MKNWRTARPAKNISMSFALKLGRITTPLVLCVEERWLQQPKTILLENYMELSLVDIEHKKTHIAYKHQKNLNNNTNLLKR